MTVGEMLQRMSVPEFLTWIALSRLRAEEADEKRLADECDRNFEAMKNGR